MSRVRVVGNDLNKNLIGEDFNSVTSETIFSLGRFKVTANFDPVEVIDYSKRLSSFSRPIKLEDFNVDKADLIQFSKNITTPILNVDKSDLQSFIRFGSAYDFMITTIEGIIEEYPGSLFINSKKSRVGNTTFFDYQHNSLNNESKFKVQTVFIENPFELVFDKGNKEKPDDKKLNNINLSFQKYVVFSKELDKTFPVIGFTGDSATNAFITVKVSGNPFRDVITPLDDGVIDFHIKPNNDVFESFRQKLTEYQKYILSERNEDGFEFALKEPSLLDDGSIRYSTRKLMWRTSDGYNLDVNTSEQKKVVRAILNIANKYDNLKTDLMVRLLTPTSLKKYDLTDDEKISKLLRVYGHEYDEMKRFIDGLVHINRISYDKKNNIPDQLLGNLSRTLGWEHFSLLDEKELLQSFFNVDDKERNLNDDFFPAEIDIELWRRILLNTNYYWKTKGTRHAIKSMFLLIGIPEPFIDITEYIYTVEGKINPNRVELSLRDFPTESPPYDEEGFPVAPLENNDFYFQVSGNTDYGETYMNVFRDAGFTLRQRVDNKKSWVEEGAITRRHTTTPQYYQGDSKLVLNTKMIDVALDSSRGIEYDVFRYIRDVDFPLSSTGFTLGNIFVNISAGLTSNEQGTFDLPANYEPDAGDIEVRLNGILLNGEKSFDGDDVVVSGDTDYIVDEVNKTFSFTNNNVATQSDTHRDVVQVTYFSETNPISGVTIEYIVTKIDPKLFDTEIELPFEPQGDIQLTVDGVALTKGTSQFNADYVVDGKKIFIQNNKILSYLDETSSYVKVAFMTLSGNTSLRMRNDIVRVDSFTGGRVFFSSVANRFVYRLPHRIQNTSDIKVLVDGVMLEPTTDYTVNPNNLREIRLPRTIKLGSVVSSYYLIADEDFFEPMLDDEFGLGDISDLSFLEFIELLHEKTINAANRKTITDHKGGWYPTLLSIYMTYLRRGRLEETNPLLSNAYNFNDLYSFLKKYNTFFQRFVDQLLPATIITKRSGLVVRNTVFTQQKFMHRRGVNLDLSLKYNGDDGALYVKKQPVDEFEWTDDSVSVITIGEAI